MKNKTQELLDKVDGMHDWDLGQTYSGGGTNYYATHTCRICGLQDHWMSDKQNGISDRHTWMDARGNEITLRDAAALAPCIEPKAPKPPVLRPALQAIIARIDELEATHCNGPVARPVDFAELRGLQEIARQALRQ